MDKKLGTTPVSRASQKLRLAGSPNYIGALGPLIEDPSWGEARVRFLSLDSGLGS